MVAEICEVYISKSKPNHNLLLRWCNNKLKIGINNLSNLCFSRKFYSCYFSSSLFLIDPPCYCSNIAQWVLMCKGFTLKLCTYPSCANPLCIGPPFQAGLCSTFFVQFELWTMLQFVCYFYRTWTYNCRILLTGCADYQTNVSLLGERNTKTRWKGQTN